MQPIRTLIADDEPLARQTLRLLLEPEPEIEIVAECGDGRQTIAAVRSTQPDLLFLDIHMPCCNGFQVIEATGLQGAAVVFVTAYDQYAVEAFRAEALDYLLKPFDDLRFSQMLRRVKERFREREWSRVGQQFAGDPLPSIKLHRVLGADGPGLSRILIRSRGRMTVLKAEEIHWVQAADNYVELHTGSRSYLLRQTIQEFGEQLDAARFLRVHRSAIVNVECIREFVAHAHGEASLILQGGTTVKVSRGRRAEVEKKMSMLSAAVRGG